MSKMKQESAEQKHLILISLLLLPVFTTGGTDKPIGCGNQKESHEDFEAGVIKTKNPSCMHTKNELLTRFNKTLTNLESCFSENYFASALSSCTAFLSHKNVTMNSQNGKRKYEFWCYPSIHCNNCSKISSNFQKCRKNLRKIEKNCSQNFTCPEIPNHFGYALIPFFPWDCEMGNDFKEKIKLSLSLYNINRKLLIYCGHLICNEIKNVFPIPIWRVNENTDLACRNTLIELKTSPTCYTKNNEFCFYAFESTSNSIYIAFISEDNTNISDTEKIVYILRNFTDLQSKGRCEYPLNYTKNNKHYLNEKTYYFCSTQSNDYNDKDSWHVRKITEKTSLVALNANVKYSIIESNVILQRLLFEKTNISITSYKKIINLNYTFQHYTNEFHIPVFNANYTKDETLRNVINGNVIIKSNKYFTKVVDNISIWGYLNWITFYDCSQKYQEDNKDLFLFLFNGTLDLEYICNADTGVLLTSIRRENVTLLHSPHFLRGCYDKGINMRTNKDCNDILRKSTDYETRFFHFLIYPRTLDIRFAVKLLSEKMNANETSIFEIDYKDNSHPSLVIGLTTILKNETNSLHSDNKGQTKSLQKTLQIFILASLSKNTECVKTLREGSFSIDKNDNGNTESPKVPKYVIGPIPFDISGATCLKILPFDVYEDLRRIQDNRMLRVNKFWPTCMYNKLIAWTENTNTTEVIPEWDYLPSSCKTMEMGLFLLCCTITFITISGNIIVITVMIFSGLVKKHVYMIYTSVAAADLLLGVITASLALLDTYDLMNGHLTIYDLNEDGPWAPFGSFAGFQPKGFQQTRFPRYGWPAYSAIAMNISILSSLMSLALLGTALLPLSIKILTFENPRNEEKNDSNRESKNLKESKSNQCDNLKRWLFYFDNNTTIKFGICIIWVWNIISAFMINTGSNFPDNSNNNTQNTLTGYFDPVTKLTLNTGRGKSNLSSTAFYLQTIVASVAGIIIVAISVTLAIVFNIKKSKSPSPGAPNNHLQRVKYFHAISRSFLLMALLFLVSCAPIAAVLFTNSVMVNLSEKVPVLHFIIWWLCMAGSSWNWLIYCFRGKYFKEEAKKVLQRFCDSI